MQACEGWIWRTNEAGDEEGADDEDAQDETKIDAIAAQGARLLERLEQVAL